MHNRLPFYSNTHIPGSKELHADYIHNQLREFRLSDKESFDVSMLSGLTNHPYTDHYHKNKHELVSGDRIDVITKDDGYHTFTWHTTPGNIKQAVRYGIVTTYSVTGQVMTALGKYRCIQLERIKQGYVGDRHREKTALMDLYQDRFELLEPLESLVNSGASMAELDTAIDAYIAKLIILQQTLPSRFQGVRIKHNKFSKSLQRDIERAKKFKANSHQYNGAMKSTGVHSALTFVKKQMIHGLREMQGYNQALTYNNRIHFALTRGDLNGCIEDAARVIEEYNAPPRDRVDSKHHGDYQSVGDKVVYDARHHCKSIADEQHAMLAISFIEGLHKVEYVDSQPMLQSGDGENHPLETVHKTKWHLNGPKRSLERIGAWFANVGIKLGAGLIELPLTVVVEPLTFGFAKPFFNTVRKWAVKEIAAPNPFYEHLNAQYQQLSHEAMHPRQSLGLRVRHFAMNAFKNTIRNVVYAAQDVGRSLTVHLFDAVVNDYRDGDESQLNVDEVLKQAEREINDINNAKQLALQKILHKLKQEGAELNDRQVRSAKKFVLPDYVPSAGDVGDPLNAFAHGLELFMDLFMHHIHAKHPFAGLLFTASYIITGLAVVAPQSVAFMGKGFLAYSQGMGYGMAKDPMTAGICSGCTQAQVLSAAYEFCLHGPDSWMATSAVEFEKDPFTASIYAGTALLLGYLVVYELDIPGLSDAMREDMGTAPITSLGFVGAKLGIGVYELLKAEDETPLAKSRYIDKVRRLLSQAIKQVSPDLSSDELNDRVTSVMDTIASPEKLDALKRLMRTHTVPMYTEKDIDRARLMRFLTVNAEHLPHMSANQKHSVFQQVRELFSYQQAESLRQLLYPKERTSIFRTFVGVVVGYPAGLLRLSAATVSSIMQENPQPLQSATQRFGVKVVRDVNRVARAATKVSKIAISFLRRHVKVLGDVVFNSVAARTEATVTGQSRFGHAVYSASGDIDCAYEDARQLASMPTDKTMRFVTAEQPASSFPKAASSYAKLAKVLKASQVGVFCIDSSAAQSRNDGHAIIPATAGSHAITSAIPATAGSHAITSAIPATAGSHISTPSIPAPKPVIPAYAGISSP